MEKDFRELVEYLDKKFSQTATKDEVRELRSGVAIVSEDVKELKGAINQLQEAMRELITTVDNLAKAVDDLRIEYSAMALQLSRHEKWIHQVADKLGIKLDY